MCENVSIHFHKVQVQCPTAGLSQRLTSGPPPFPPKRDGEKAIIFFNQCPTLSVKVTDPIKTFLHACLPVRFRRTQSWVKPSFLINDTGTEMTRGEPTSAPLASLRSPPTGRTLTGQAQSARYVVASRHPLGWPLRVDPPTPSRGRESHRTGPQSSKNTGLEQ